MTTTKELLTANQSITCTITSLTNTSQQQSAAVDNSTNLFVDAGVQVKVKTAASSTSATGVVNVFAYGSADGGTDYTGGCSGSDTSYSPSSPTNLKLIGVINANANSTTYVGGPFSVAAAFGYLPGKWGVVIDNETGATLDASVGSAWFEGQALQTA